MDNALERRKARVIQAMETARINEPEQMQPRIRVVVEIVNESRFWKAIDER
jgi:hypothetical protein